MASVIMEYHEQFVRSDGDGRWTPAHLKAINIIIEARDQVTRTKALRLFGHLPIDGSLEDTYLTGLLLVAAQWFEKEAAIELANFDPVAGTRAARVSRSTVSVRRRSSSLLGRR